MVLCEPDKKTLTKLTDDTIVLWRRPVSSSRLFKPGEN